MKDCGLNDNKVTEQLSLSTGLIGKSRKKGRDLSKKLANQILNFYTDIEKVWLLTGEGEEPKKKTGYPIQNVDQKANVKDKGEICKDCEERDATIKSLNNYINHLEKTIENLGENINQGRPTPNGKRSSA